MSELPFFQYHPEPIRTGAIRRQAVECAACGRLRDYTYVASVYARESLRERICPWCIADGSAAARFDAEFSDSHPLIEGGLPAATVAEVTRRTPGYNSWQQEVWQTHCNDACAFYGDATVEQLRCISPEAKAKLLSDNGIPARDWERFLAEYTPGGNPAIYRFVCLHCAASIFTMDFT